MSVTMEVISGDKNTYQKLKKKLRRYKQKVILILATKRREVAVIFEDYAYAFYPGEIFIYDYTEYDILGDLRK